MNDELPENLTLLVVDDDSVVRLLLEEVLSKSYKVLTAEDGVQAWELIQGGESEIHVVLSDLEMPGLDGLGLLKRIAAEFPAICVIMLSGSSDISLAVQAMRKGAHDYIAKPFSDLEELEIMVERWFHQQSLEQKLAQYATLHRDMMRNMKTRTFAALDVVGSKGIKKDQDPFLVQFSFAAYHDFVADIVQQHEGVIHGTAGDGIMTCFESASAAVNGMVQILSQLSAFNGKRNQLSKDFALRIGMHTGSVIVEKNGRINEMFSETLDIAGHIQKAAAKDSLVVSEATLGNLEKKEGFVQTNEAIDEFAVYAFSATPA
jgi:CheY-like chemotaxis protein